MKKILISALILFSANLMAQWPKDSTQFLNIRPANQNANYIEHRMCPNTGNTWVFWFDLRNVDFGSYTAAVMVSHVTLLDKEGNLKLDSSGVNLGIYPGHSYSLVGKRLFADNYGNAVIVVVDSRNHDNDGNVFKRNTFLYKISPTGDLLWGDDGIELEKTETYDIQALHSMVQLENGNYILYVYGDNKSNTLYKIDEGGHVLAKKSIGLGGEIIKTDNNQFIVASGTSAMKYDADLNPLWNNIVSIRNPKDMEVYYRDGDKAISDGEGGVIMTFSEDEALKNRKSMFISRISKNGNIMIINKGTGDKYVGVGGLDGFQQVEKAIAYDKGSNSIYALFGSNHFATKTVTYCGIQRVDATTGECLWGTDGVGLILQEPRHLWSYGGYFLDVFPDKENLFVNYYVDRQVNIQGVPVFKYFLRTRKLDLLTGADKWYCDSLDLLNNPGHTSLSHLSVTPLCKNRWTMSWTNNNTLQLTSLYIDGSIGYNPDLDPVAIAIKRKENDIKCHISPIPAVDYVNIEVADDIKIQHIRITDINGKYIVPVIAGANQIYLGNIPAGTYFATISTTKGIVTKKIIKK